MKQLSMDETRKIYGGGYYRCVTCGYRTNSWFWSLIHSMGYGFHHMRYYG